jgi:hypothetical protein
MKMVKDYGFANDVMLRPYMIVISILMKEMGLAIILYV